MLDVVPPSYQPLYFVAESFASAKDMMRRFALTLSRPFHVRFNPYTESMEILTGPKVWKQTADDVLAYLLFLVPVLVSPRQHPPPPPPPPFVLDPVLSSPLNPSFVPPS